MSFGRFSFLFGRKMNDLLASVLLQANARRSASALAVAAVACSIEDRLSRALCCASQDQQSHIEHNACECENAEECCCVQSTAYGDVAVLEENPEVAAVTTIVVEPSDTQNEDQTDEIASKNDDDSSGWSLLNPVIQLNVCTKMNHPAPLVVRYMTDCTRYHEWWPSTYDFKVVRCTPDIVDTLIEFNSTFGSYASRGEKLEHSTNPPQTDLTLKYFGDILEGDMHWRINALSKNKCELCYVANLMPKTMATQMAASVS